MYMFEVMNVMLVSDDNFVFLLLVSLWSLFESNREIPITVYIISDNISKDNIDKIYAIAHKFKKSIVIIDAPKLNNISITGEYNITTFYRLKMASLLPADVNRVLYMDCDTLVCRELHNFYFADLKGYVIAGVWDTTYPSARYDIGLDDNDIYINAGVLLIDLDKWRKDGYEDKCFTYLREQNYQVQFNDQGIINHVCRGKIKIVNLRYNLIWPYMGLPYFSLSKRARNEMFYSKEEIAEAVDNPAIVHFAGEAYLRPWYDFSISPYVDEFNSICSQAGLLYEKRKYSMTKKMRFDRWVISRKKPINGYLLLIVRVAHPMSFS